jgi:uncharacterized protein (TIGR02099 family)
VKPASFYAAYIVKKLWKFAALSFLLVAVLLSVLRYSLPYMDSQKHHLENWLENKFGAQLRIGEINASWNGSGPAIVLRKLQLIQNSQSPISLDIEETFIEVDFWASIFAQQIQSQTFDLRGMSVSLDIHLLQQEDSDFPIVDALEHLFLQQLQSFSVSGSKILLVTEHDQQTILVEQLSWSNQGMRHQGVGQLQVEELTKNSASFVLDLYGNQDDLRGTFFAKAEEIDLSPWLSQWLTTRYELTESRGNFVLWAGIEQNSLRSIQVDLADSRFGWATDDSTIHASILGGQLSASPIGNEWAFNLDNLVLQVNDEVLVSNWLGKLSQGNLNISNAQALQIDKLLPLLPLTLEQETFAFLEQFQPQATVDRLDLQLSPSGLAIAKLKISQLGWQQSDIMPGMSDLSAEINWFENKGRLSLLGKDSALSTEQILGNNIAYQQFKAELYISPLAQGMQFYLPHVSLSSDWLNISQSMFYRSHDNYLALSGQIAELNVSDVKKLFPAVLMGQDTKDYLLEALLDGEVQSAQFLWSGKLDRFPFTKQDGIFQAGVNIQQANMRFHSEWPALSNLDIDLLFENEGLAMNSQQGKLLDIDLNDLHASIPSLAPGAILRIEAQASAGGKQVRTLMQQSSIADSLGVVLEQVQLDKPLSTSLNLHIPLSGQNIVAKGEIQLPDNDIYIPSLQLNFKRAKGSVTFNNDVVEFDQLSANLLGQDVKIDFAGQNVEQSYVSEIKLRGDWQITPLLEKYHPGMSMYLSGSSDWQADIALSIPKEGYEYSASITSELNLVDSELPVPFAKSSEQTMPLRILSKGNQQASTVDISLGDDIEFSGNLPHQDMQFSRAHLAIGQTDTVGMGLGFSIAINLPELDSNQWYPTISTLLADLSDSETPLIGAPQRIFVSADTALIASQKLTDFELLAKNTSDSWLFDLNAKQARAKITLHKDWLGSGVDVKADFIDLADWQGESANTKAMVFSPDLATLPPVKFECLRCSFHGNELGRVDFTLSRAAGGMHIDSLRLNNSHGLFYATGDWYLSDNQSSTRLVGEFSSSDFGAFLQDFKFNSGIKDSKAGADFDLTWQRAPYEFNYASLDGDVDWRLTDGYLTDVPDKGSRIFSILSLESLVRKLKLDFRDVFAKGFFYDKMKGSLQIVDGIADTRDTLIDGGAGEITMQGYSDLVNMQLNYQLAFAPKVTSSLPVIIAYMVNPATALAALALDQVLTSAKVISNIKFSLTGSFDEPQLEELQRDSKDISLPAQVTPSQDIRQTPEDVDAQLDIPVSVQILIEDSESA